jgi:hypothetical protein
MESEFEGEAPPEVPEGEPLSVPEGSPDARVEVLVLVEVGTELLPEPEGPPVAVVFAPPVAAGTEPEVRVAFTPPVSEGTESEGTESEGTESEGTGTEPEVAVAFPVLCAAAKPATARRTTDSKRIVMEVGV